MSPNEDLEELSMTHLGGSVFGARIGSSWAWPADRRILPASPRPAPGLMLIGCRPGNGCWGVPPISGMGPEAPADPWDAKSPSR